MAKKKQNMWSNKRKTKGGYLVNKNGVPLNSNGVNALKGCNYALNNAFRDGY